MKLRHSILCTTVLLGGTLCHAIDASVWQSIPSFCGAATGRLEVSVVGGSPPYTYSWSTGGTDHYIANQVPGVYSVTVTDADLDEITVQGEVEDQTYSSYYGDHIGPPQVQGWCTEGTPYVYPAGAFANPQGDNWVGPGPWTFTVNGVTTATLPNACYNPFADPYAAQWYLPLDYPVGTNVTINFSDGNGCPGSTTFNIKPPIPEIPLQVLSVSGSCSGLALGSVVVSTGPWVEPVPMAYYLGVAIRTAGGGFISPECGVSGVQDAPESGSMRTFTGLPPGDYEVVVRPSDPTMLAQPEFAACQFVSFTIPDLGANCGVVTGRAFMDYNLNCTRQTNEPYVPGGIVEVLPGPYYATTSNQGLYSLTLPSGAYTITQQSEILGEHCTVGPIPFNINNGQTATVNFPDTSSVNLDVRMTVSSGIARPGFEFEYALNVRNLTPAASGATTVSFTFDPTLLYTSATPAPSNVSGSTITWNQAQLTAFQSRGYRIRFQVPPDVGLLGYELEATATVATANADGNLANNTAVNYRTITGAYDPNDKLAYTSNGSTEVWQLDEDEWIDYTIRFQNTGTDTAFNVVITDTLPPTLDPGSIIVGAASHNFTWELRDAGTLKFYFPNILLPDSNINEPLSHGFASFRIKPRTPVMPGSTIENTANIYFDFNPPVITEPSVLTVSEPSAQLQVKVMLGGAYDSGTGLMNDALRAGALIPLTEPYTGLGYAFVGGGGESINAGLLATTGPTAVVDWVVVEVRSSSTPSQIVESRAALLRRDGRVVGVNGSTSLGFTVPAANYHVAIRHRNHLGCMTLTPVTVSVATPLIDLSVASTTTWGSAARNNVDGTMVLVPGDANFDHRVMYTGTLNDRDPVLVEIGGTIPTNVVSGLYAGTDVNLDGEAKYTGELNDRDIILRTIGGAIATAIRYEQIP